MFKKPIISKFRELFSRASGGLQLDHDSCPCVRLEPLLVHVAFREDSCSMRGCECLCNLVHAIRCCVYARTTLPVVVSN